MNPLLERRIEALAAVLALLEHDLGIPRSAKAAAILAGAPSVEDHVDSFGDNYRGKPFLKALVDARRGDPESNEYIKAVLGTSNATGLSIVPNNFVAEVAQRTSAGNVYRQICNVVTGINGAAVDIPYEADEISAALLQGAYGSNKDVRDFTFGEVTATCTPSRRLPTSGTSFSASPTEQPRQSPVGGWRSPSPRPRPRSSRTAPAPTSRAASSPRSATMAGPRATPRSTRRLGQRPSVVR